MNNIPTGFVYIWRDRKRNMYYIGSHMGKMDDGYVGSNERLLRVNDKRPGDLKRRIIEYYYGDDRKELLKLEQKYLSMIKHEELNVKYYNAKDIASGLSGKVASDLKKAYWASDRSNKQREELSHRMKTRNPSSNGNFTPWNKGKLAPQISAARKGQPFAGDKEKVSAASKAAWARGAFDNRPAPTQEAIAKGIDTRKANGSLARSDYQKQRAREANKGKIVSDETKAKLSEIARERWKVIEACPNCGHIGKGPAMRRWHFDNCRH